MQKINKSKKKTKQLLEAARRKLMGQLSQPSAAGGNAALEFSSVGPMLDFDTPRKTRR